MSHQTHSVTAPAEGSCGSCASAAVLSVCWWHSTPWCFSANPDGAIYLFSLNLASSERAGWESAGRQPGKRRREVQGEKRWARGATQDVVASHDCTVTAQLCPPLPMGLAVFEYSQNLPPSRFPPNELSRKYLPTQLLNQCISRIFPSLTFRLEYCKVVPWQLSVTSLVRLSLGETLRLAGHAEGISNIPPFLAAVLPNLLHQLRYEAAPNNNLTHSPT